MLHNYYYVSRSNTFLLQNEKNQHVHHFHLLLWSVKAILNITGIALINYNPFVIKLWLVSLLSTVGTCFVDLNLPVVLDSSVVMSLPEISKNLWCLLTPEILKSFLQVILFTLSDDNAIPIKFTSMELTDSYEGSNIKSIWNVQQGTTWDS